MLLQRLLACSILLLSMVAFMTGCTTKGYAPPPDDEMERMHEMEWNLDPWR